MPVNLIENKPLTSVLLFAGHFVSVRNHAADVSLDFVFQFSYCVIRIKWYTSPPSHRKLHGLICRYIFNPTDHNLKLCGQQMQEDIVCVIGAAHLDIVGDYDSRVCDAIDKAGTIVYSVGGTAYNIAENMAQNSVPVCFISYLKESSLITPIIISRLESYNINTNHLLIVPSIGESGFVAQREDGILITAVTSTAVERFCFSPESYSDVLTKSRLIVCDCNISSASLNNFARWAHEHGKKLVVAGVSELKISRILEVEKNESSPFPFFIVAGNKKEWMSVGVDICFILEKHDVRELCCRVGAEHVIITDSENGYSVFSLSGCRRDYEAPKVARIRSRSGAGDALVAAVCYYYWRCREIDWDKCDRSVARFVSLVLEKEGATAGARTAPDELKVVPYKNYEEYKEVQTEKIVELVGSRFVKIFGYNIPATEIFGFVGLVAMIVSAILTFLVG
ncbi:PfkB family carbohydrate kinase [Rhodospira trueperi]|uniref:Sugar or nucleoside kinase, ribokinase family n=1 Tax=Rhodospira trueperi TaxID=69960 RepID=A0A1G7HH19_9PROT|nr:PfkB family carbohydrate kinase [Rhodospira trueperi]SDE99715.1 Sugar or nucleoside kinase, ribokinase family [Rhodospira trueperi]